jgi:hypothetical protein
MAHTLMALQQARTRSSGSAQRTARLSSSPPLPSSVLTCIIAGCGGEPEPVQGQHRQKCGGLARILPRSALASDGQVPPHTENACSLCSLHLFRHTTLAMDIRHDTRHD